MFVFFCDGFMMFFLQGFRGCCSGYDGGFQGSHPDKYLVRR